MAADTTAVKSAEITLTENVNYKVNLTGAGNYIDLIGHGHGTRHDIYYVVAGAEGDLPDISGMADGVRVVHTDERIRIPAPRNDCWILLRAAGGYRITVEKVATTF